MATDRTRALLDSLGTMQQRDLERLKNASASPAAADNPLGLRYAVGARVLDLITGKIVTVQHGARDQQTNEELYRVQLPDASIHYRGKDQLAAAPVGQV